MLNKYRKNPQYKLRKFGGNSYLFNSDSAFEVNEVGVSVWKNIGKQKTIDELAKELQKLYNNAEQSSISIDIDDFIRTLLAENMITIRR
ncbi:hypothetical protein WFA24289_01870 [Periweissella fabaria]|uniref:PqqD family protein n=1 Tax=Periweissella fabaria TaxID=546157 RepID=A0ABN8BL78_9LACO|nr:PqqD family protein [Periweissella fabaria]CAH0417528.1 hypothetical protein WFA24289_01870 [Periweissella fabaria]